jgi:hypothetical protein
MANVSLGDLEQALNTVDFPADKDKILDHAVQQRANADVQQALRSLQPVEYGNAQEVIRSVHADVGAERVEALDADPDNRTDAPGVADRLR